MRRSPLTPALAIALALLGPVALPFAGAYPDPGAVPRYYPSACYDDFSKRFVHDYLEIIPPTWGVEMEGAACEIYRQTSAHFVFVTTTDTEGESLENYALHLFRDWGIGDRMRHDGIMMLYVEDYLKSGESALRIEVGYGLEGAVNSLVTETAWDLMIDARDRALDAGEDATSARVYAMATGMAYLLDVIRESYVDGAFPPPDPAGDGSEGGVGRIVFNIVVILLVIAVIGYLAARADTRGGRPGWGYTPSSPSWRSPASRIWVPPSSGGPWGGGGTFGGGHSGGGGRGGRF